MPMLQSRNYLNLGRRACATNARWKLQIQFYNRTEIQKNYNLGITILVLIYVSRLIYLELDTNENL
jgi:hypothetical protein